MTQGCWQEHGHLTSAVQLKRTFPHQTLTMYKFSGRKGPKELRPVPRQDGDRPALVQALSSTCEFSTASAVQCLVVSIPHHTSHLPALTFLPTACDTCRTLWGEGAVQMPRFFLSIQQLLIFPLEELCFSEVTAGDFKQRLF